MLDRFKRVGVIVLAVVGLDQITKALAVYALSSGSVEVIPGFADLILVYNTGASFSMFAGWAHASWLLIVVTLAALGVAVWMLMGRPGKHRGIQLCLGLIMGGAVGNLIDRLRLGRVIDFVDLHVFSLHWPAFNAADAAITIGGVILAILFLRGKV